MNTYTIYIGATPIACVDDIDVAFDCYDAAKTIGKYTDKSVSLVGGETGEEVAYSDPTEECSDDESNDPECRFDPFEGCYVYD